MTTIAWDGKTLSADKMAANHGYPHKVTKIHKHNGELIFGAGDLDYLVSVINWYKNGANIENYPQFQTTDQGIAFHVINKEGLVMRYERTPYPFIIEEKIHACGSGRDYALAAMYMGADSAKAIEVASLFDINTGLGVDTLTLE